MSLNFSIKIIFENDYLTFAETSGLQSVSLLSESVADNTLPTYGVIARTGSVSFIDSNSAFLNKIKSKDCPIEVEIYQNNVLWGSFVATKKCTYNVFSKEATMEIKGNITNWQSTTVEKKAITYDQTAYQILLYLISLQDIAPTISDVGISNDTVTFLQSITVPYFYLESGTLWEQFDKLCNLAQLRIYQDKKNKVIIERYV